VPRRGEGGDLPTAQEPDLHAGEVNGTFSCWNRLISSASDVGMIEIAVALATAEAAVAGIKRAIQVGKDAHDCLGEFLQLFDARDQVQKASNEERKSKPQQSVMSEALESVIAARKIRQMEQELQQYLIWSGQGDVWNEIVQEHNSIIQKRKAAELAAQREVERKEQERKERALILVVIGIGGIILFNIGRYIYEAWPE